MARSSASPRTLVIGPATYRWRVSHRHRSAVRATCEELFTAYLEGRPRGPLRIRFVDDVDHGAEYVPRRGLVTAHAAGAPTWNLNLPATARRLIEIGIARGWTPVTAPRPFEIEDGWSVLGQLAS